MGTSSAGFPVRIAGYENGYTERLQKSRRPSRAIPRIPAERHTEHGAGNGYGQRQNIGQIRSPPNAAGGDGNVTRSPIMAPMRWHPIGLRTAAEHLGQLLPATAAFFMTAPAAALLHFDQA
jgi:hypothetical protein